MITYLDKKEMDALLNLPDKQTEQGWRDYVLLLFLYNTGARAEEAATLQVKDLFIPKGKGIPVVTITGKGSKTRRCPLWNDTCKLLHDIVDNKKPDDNVFMSRLHKPISRFGIYEMVTKYARKLEETIPSIKGKQEPTASTEQIAAICMSATNSATVCVNASGDEKSSKPNAVAIFKKVNNGPKPVSNSGSVATKPLL